MSIALSLTILALVLAGCTGGGSNREKQGEYRGEFKEFDLFLYPLTTNGQSGGWQLYPGTNVDAWAFSPEPDAKKATVPGPTIRAREGDTVRVNFYSLAPMAHTIHWHGIHVPWDQDGVPYMSQLPIGDRAFGGNGSKVVTYEFTLKQSGTYWYHCHVDTAHHLDMGMYGAFIIDPADSSQDPAFDQETTMMLDEWDKSHAHQNAAAMNAAISRSGDPRVTANDVYASMRDYLVMNQVYNDMVAGGVLKNAPGVRETRDWYPVTYAPYFAEYDTFLINGRAMPLTEPVFVKSGETLRIRLVNAGSQVHSMHLHGHHFLITHKDGFLLPEGARYYADTLLIGPGERYDLFVRLDNPGPWMFHDHIALNEANDYISPGGMSTTICYRDGWTNADLCEKGHVLHGTGSPFGTGALLEAQAAYLGVHRASGAGPATSTIHSMPAAPAPAPASPSNLLPSIG